MHCYPWPGRWSCSLDSRIRVFVSGIQVENWDFSGESAVLTDGLKGAARRQNDSVEHHLLTSGTGDAYQSIAASGARKVMFQLPCGTTMMDKWMPMSLVSGGLVIEMELSADVDQAFDNTNTPNWELKDVSMLCSMRTIDSSLANSYAKHMLSGNSINFHTKSMVTTKHLITKSTFTIPIVRGFSRLCQVYMTLHKRSVSTEKPILGFYSPVNNAALSTTSDVATFQLSIGSRRWPERPSDSIGEQWLRLREAAGVAYGESEISILPTDFINR